MTRSLDCDRQRSLMCGAGSGDSSRKNLAALRDVLAELCCVLIIDDIILSAENTDLLLSVEAALLSEGPIASLTLSHPHPP